MTRREPKHSNRAPTHTQLWPTRTPKLNVPVPKLRGKARVHTRPDCPLGSGRSSSQSIESQPQATGRYRARPPGDPRRCGPPRDATTILNQAELSGLASASCEKTELVALEIGEDHPSLFALPNIDVACAEVEQPR